MRGRLFAKLLMVVLVSFCLPARASHIVGGEVTYRCLGSNQYEITVTIYEDCLTGLSDAIAQDDPAYINIFTGATALFNDPYHPYDSIFLKPPGRVLVPTNFSNACIDHAPATCLQKAVFVKTYYLPPNANGYTIVYQRCCRNASILNVINPSAVGATYSCQIPPASKAICNNSAVFKNYPPQIICINNPLVYDHSATDPDGDSLSYEFAPAYSGGTDGNPKPAPTLLFDTVHYRYPYKYFSPMAGYPQIKIDPRSGLITGTPNLIGRFVVTVSCHEWRNHQMINTVTREFQFVVTDCSKAVVADIPQYSTDFNTYEVNCSNYTVNFVNQSKGGFAYYWNFGDSTTEADTSNEFQPTYTYPDTGTYIVKLLVNKGTTCPDSITRYVKIYPVFRAGFDYNGLQCPGGNIQFTDKTSSTYKPITGWAWDFGDGDTSTSENPDHTYRQGGLYKAQLITQNYKGCVDTLTKQVNVDKFKPFAGNDTIILKGETMNFDAKGGISYAWRPAEDLNAANTANPYKTFNDTGRFAYIVTVTSAYGCTGEDTVNVWVVNYAAAFVPSAFTPNGDGRNDYLRPILIGYSNLNSFEVFNRWGELCYHTTSTDAQGWDGTYNGKRADIGTYFWIMKVTDRFGKEKVLKGDVTLIR